MGPRIQVFAVAVILVMALATPGAAATETNQAPTLQGIVQEAQRLLQPFARQRNLTIAIEASCASPIAAPDADKMRERVINLLANGIALSPENNQVVVKLSPTQELSVWIGNDQVATSVDRDIRDQAGNFFKVRSTAGRGTELSTRFVNSALGSVSQ